jgi:hypothetical protein
MKHSSTQAIYRYWNDRRGTRPAPERADIDPGDIRHQLGDTFMLAADFVDVLRFRLAGTRVCALFNRELKGEGFASLWDETSRKSNDELITAVCREQTGGVAGLLGRTADGTTVELEMLLLPLAHGGHARIRALGVLVPTVPLYWLGEKPVVELSLRALRHIGGGLDELTAPRFALAPTQVPEQAPLLAPSAEPLPAGSRIRHGFVVYSGGRGAPSGDQTG